MDVLIIVIFTCAKCGVQGRSGFHEVNALQLNQLAGGWLPRRTEEVTDGYLSPRFCEVCHFGSPYKVTEVLIWFAALGLSVPIPAAILEAFQ